MAQKIEDGVHPTENNSPDNPSDPTAVVTDFDVFGSYVKYTARGDIVYAGNVCNSEQFTESFHG